MDPFIPVAIFFFIGLLLLIVGIFSRRKDVWISGIIVSLIAFGVLLTRSFKGF